MGIPSWFVQISLCLDYMPHFLLSLTVLFLQPSHFSFCLLNLFLKTILAFLFSFWILTQLSWSWNRNASRDSAKTGVQLPLCQATRLPWIPQAGQVCHTKHVQQSNSRSTRQRNRCCQLVDPGKMEGSKSQGTATQRHFFYDRPCHHLPYRFEERREQFKFLSELICLCLL